MNKTELVAHIARHAELPLTKAQRALEGFIDGVQTTLRNDDELNLVGFGTFVARERAARTGRNPRTGEQLTIPATRAPVFRPGKGLRDALTTRGKSTRKMSAKPPPQSQKPVPGKRTPRPGARA